MHCGNVCLNHVAKFKMAETDTVVTVRETITIVPVTGAIYHNDGQEKPTERWSIELGLNLSEDKILSTELKRLEKGYGIKEKCAALNISKFKLEASAKPFAYFTAPKSYYPQVFTSTYYNDLPKLRPPKPHKLSEKHMNRGVSF